MESENRMVFPGLLAFQNSSQKAFPDLKQATLDWEEHEKTRGTMHFISPLSLWETEKPFNINLPLPNSQPKTNTIMNAQEMEFADARRLVDTFSLDVYGFGFTKMAQAAVDFKDKDAVEQQYLPEVEKHVKKITGASKVQSFDYTLRQVKAVGAQYTWGEKRPPARNAHIDQTPEASMRRLQLYFQDNATEIAKGRVQIINLWRPLFGPIEETPLAVCDARSLTDEDLLAQDIIHAHHIGENYLVKYNINHCWYYLSNMQDTECILIKNFDSELDGRARICPHAAFIDGASSSEARPRESIEVRLMVFHE